MYVIFIVLISVNSRVDMAVFVCLSIRINTYSSGTARTNDNGGNISFYYISQAWIGILPRSAVQECPLLVCLLIKFIQMVF